MTRPTAAARPKRIGYDPRAHVHLSTGEEDDAITGLMVPENGWTLVRRAEPAV